ncbi:hypothetical protein DEU56DRAFT_759948 [Suillus clintonianus]|uniref:uncharacterized protein n=1 Tax=Suillus clintonianus TaxID=1904413 RepID=UPI001B87CB64|nr:uncharacterized protein DEU56DRAFT_759948 [Suillus clintonianus]KAG2123735.1 hypothetical protein DEU56DRAFT_759948 [Suillus clintonianus]
MALSQSTRQRKKLLIQQERFGFKPPSAADKQDPTQPSRNHNKAREEATQRDVRDDGCQDSDHDQLENGAHANHTEYDEDTYRSGDDNPTQDQEDEEDSRDDEEDPDFRDLLPTETTTPKMIMNVMVLVFLMSFNVTTRKMDGARLLPRLVYQVLLANIHLNMHLVANHLKVHVFRPLILNLLSAPLKAVLTHPVPEHLDAQNSHEKSWMHSYGLITRRRSNWKRLCDNLFAFRTELKKVIISIAKQLYSIFPKSSSTRREAAQKHITDVASKLIKSGEYLQIPNSSEGKYKNFVSQVLKDGCHNFYYSNGKKALKLTDKFQRSIPVNSLILVAASQQTKGVISGFHDTGTNKVPDLSADKCSTERRQELDKMLEEWAEYRMMDELQDDSDGASGSEDVNIILKHFQTAVLHHGLY